MSKGTKMTNIKTIKKPKKSSSKEKPKTRKLFSYHFVKRKKVTKSKMKKDNFPSVNFGSTKPTFIDLELVDSEHQKPLDNTIIREIFFANDEEPDFFSYDNICKVNSNKVSNYYLENIRFL